ncbi:Peptidyl-prolyl cis-trans isomerase G [Hibiscus syriacus]|uniref:Peptidyl-prolyl cis-trans isomerase G n=1 Tax=Hibiscus syriacus TaxID=106335 RepID=A0A6A2ZHP1_HIBSY|nr:Peptidyl-prolyl cis-trans isomerase G [Hibiscus syriacus]
MGDGAKIDFWNEHWTEVNSLKASFPRIFGLAIKKSGKIKAVSLAPSFDRLKWVGSADGRFYPKSFCSKVASAEVAGYHRVGKVWVFPVLLILFVLSAIELQNLLIMFYVNVSVYGRFGNVGVLFDMLILFSH